MTIHLNQPDTWPEIHSYWQHRNGNRYQILGFTNVESERQDEYPTTIRYRNVRNDKEYSRALMDWDRSMTRLLKPTADDRRTSEFWTSEQNERHRRHLGKLIEELGELSGIAARCLIQGVDGEEPVTGKLNEIALLEELADAHALIILNKNHFFEDYEQEFQARTTKKQRLLLPWVLDRK